MSGFPNTKGGGGILGLGRPPTIALLGDSITEANDQVQGFPAGYQAGGATIQSGSYGYWTWADQFMKGALTAVSNNGIGGFTTTQFVAVNLPAVLALSPRPGWCIVEGGTNDFADSIPTATTLANLIQIYTTLLNAGINVIATTICPNVAHSSTQGYLNRKIRAFAEQQQNMLFVDWYQYLVDPATGSYATNLSDDGVHPNDLGASLMGLALSNALDSYLPPIDQLAAGSEADSEELITNGYMLGTTGSLGTSTGQLATGWTSRQGTGAVFSKVARSDLIQGSWQQMALTSVSNDIYAFASVQPPGGSLVQAFIEYQIDPAAVFTEFDLRIDATCQTNQNSGSTGVGSQNPNWPASGMLRTPPTLTLPGGSGAILHLYVSGTGTVRVSRASYKVLS